MTVRILEGDVFDQLAMLPDESVHCCVTSPPYWGLRDYGVPGQLGLEPTLGEHIDVMVRVFREIRRVLRKDGTLWLNYGDCYATAPNGRSAADTKAAGNDDRTFRDKPFSTVGPIYDSDYRERTTGGIHAARRPDAGGRVVSGGNLKPKDLCMIPSRLAIALQDDGWWVRSEIIWAKPNPMPESVTDRPTNAHEKVFLLTKSARYWYDAEAVRQPVAESQVGRIRDDAIGGKSWQKRGQHSEGGKYKTDKQADHGPHGKALTSPRNDGNTWNENNGRGFIPTNDGANLRNVWNIATKPFSEAHFATFPPDLPEICIKAGCPKSGTVLDPFAGAGTTGLVADRLGRNAILIELNPEYAAMARDRIQDDAPLFSPLEPAELRT